MNKKTFWVTVSVFLFLGVCQANDWNKAFELLDHPGLWYIERSENHQIFRGIATSKDKVIVPCEFTKINHYKNGLSVENREEKFGVYDYNGKEILPVIFDSMVILMEDDNSNSDLFRRTLRYTMPDGRHKQGLCDAHGQIIVPYTEYDSIADAGCNLVTVYNANTDKWGLYGNGRELLRCEYDKPLKFKNDVATARKDGQVMVLKNPLKQADGIRVAELALESKSEKRKAGEPAKSRYPAPDSDVDLSIPSGTKPKENRFAVIIANENYEEAPVPYALNDGRIFREYCIKVLGVPEKQVMIYEDATYGSLIAAVEQTKNLCAAFDGEAEVLFYYAGHGVPNEKDASAYLLPIDGVVSEIASTGYSLTKLYGEFAAMPASSVTMFIDACFSGAKREDEMLLTGRGVAIKAKEEKPVGNLVVFSASTGDETAHQLADKHHGLFTYYLLKGMQSAGSTPELGALADYVTKQVKRQSVLINQKRQTPTIIPSAKMSENWRTRKL